MQEWLQAWKNFTDEERHYATIIGPAGHLQGALPAAAVGPPAGRQRGHRQAADQAVQADRRRNWAWPPAGWSKGRRPKRPSAERRCSTTSGREALAGHSAAASTAVGLPRLLTTAYDSASAAPTSGGRSSRT